MFETKYKCDDCSHVFYRVSEKDPRKVTKGRPPSCPECRKKKVEDIGRITVRGDVKIQTQKDRDKKVAEIIKTKSSPSVGGANIRNKAFDATAEIVMQDYGMTNIEMNSNLRQGDSCVPKLAPELERKVDDVFKPQVNKVAGVQGNALTDTLKKQINAGAFRNYGGAGDVVARQQTSGIRIPVNNIYEYSEKPK